MLDVSGTSLLKGFKQESKMANTELSTSHLFSLLAQHHFLLSFLGFHLLQLVLKV